MRLLRVIAVTTAIVVGVPACSSGDLSNASESATNTGSESETLQPTDSGISDSELGARLDSALVSLRDAYSFNTRVELDGELVTSVVGDNIAGASAFMISTTGTTLEVVTVGGLVWSRVAGTAEWATQVEADISADPLGPLLDSTDRSISGEQITVKYPGASFGLDAEFVDVAVRLDGDAIELVHRAGAVTVRSRLEPAPPGTTVTAPG